LLGWFRSAEAATPSNPAPTAHNNRNRRDERGNRHDSMAGTSTTRQPRRESAQQNSPKSTAQLQARSNRQRNNETQSRPAQQASTQVAKAERQPKPVAVENNNQPRAERKPSPPKTERAPRAAVNERPAAAPLDDSAKEAELLVTPLATSPAPEPAEDATDADGSQSRRRRGRRGGRRRRRHDEAAPTGTDINSEQAQALDDEDRDETAGTIADQPATRNDMPRETPAGANAVRAGAIDGAASASSPDAHPLNPAVEPVEKPAVGDATDTPMPTAAIVAASSAVAPVVAFNLPPLPPIPDQAKPATVSVAVDRVALDAMPPIAAAADTSAHAQQTAAAINVVAPSAKSEVAFTTPETGSKPVVVSAETQMDSSHTDPDVAFVRTSSAAQPAPTPVQPVTTAPAVSGVPAPTAPTAPAPVAKPAGTVAAPAPVAATPAPIDATEDSTDTDAAPASQPKQGDLLAQPTHHPVKPITPDSMESKPVAPLPNDTSRAHEGDLHG
jgi:ribonuclease E